MNCEHCEIKIPVERLEVLPFTTKCVKCAAKYPDEPLHDPNDVCAVASDTGRNGFAPNN